MVFRHLYLYLYINNNTFYLIYFFDNFCVVIKLKMCEVYKNDIFSANIVFHGDNLFLFEVFSILFLYWNVLKLWQKQNAYLTQF